MTNMYSADERLGEPERADVKAIQQKIVQPKPLIEGGKPNDPSRMVWDIYTPEQRMAAKQARVAEAEQVVEERMCIECGRTFTTDAGLKRHQTAAHGDLQRTA